MIIEQAGDDIIWDVALVDKATQQPIPASTVSRIWAAIGTARTYDSTTDPAVLTKVGDNIRITLPALDSQEWRGRYPIWVKVVDTNNTLITIVDGELVDIQQTPLTDKLP